MSKYVPSIGMEVHAEMLTKTKMFCRCPVEFGSEPNTKVCPVCLGLPGALPVPNRHAIELVLKTALALNCKIAMHSLFHRKNYFYPDLPKGYQISQYGETNPLGYNGWLEIPIAGGKTKKIRISRVHLEEDTGKLMHLPGGGSGIDYNRSGVPLMEIVTAFPPAIESSEEAKEYLFQLRQILIYVGACDGKMEEGSLRCEPNISVRPEGSETYGTKTELKNLNSFKSVQAGVAHEIARQTVLIKNGEKVQQHTLGWDETKQVSFVMRVKELEHDYRYFEDPDLSSMEFTEEYIESLRQSLPELPLTKFRRYQADYGLSAYDAKLLTADKAWAEYFEKTMELGGDPKQVCNWMNSDLSKLMNESGQKVDIIKVTPDHLIELLGFIESKKISGKIGKDVLEECFHTGFMPFEIIEKQGLIQISDPEKILFFVQETLQNSPDIVEKFCSGQESVLGYLVGQVMKKTSGKANPELVQKILREQLNQ